MYDVLRLILFCALVLVRHFGRRVLFGICRLAVVAKKLRSSDRDQEKVGLGLLGEVNKCCAATASSPLSTAEQN